MGPLLRISSGQFHIDSSVKLDELERLAKKGGLEEHLISIEQALYDFPRIELNERGDKYLHNGNRISSHYIIGHSHGLEPKEKILVYDSELRLGGIYELSGDMKYLRPVTMLL